MWSDIMKSTVTTKGRRKQLAQIEIEKRQGCSKTYTLPIPNEDSYMKYFYNETIFSKGLEMKRLLVKYPDTIGEHYSILVPDTISFGCFWGRYYYNCSMDRLLQEWDEIEACRMQQHHNQLNAVIVPIACKHRRESIERGLGSRSPENTIESIGQSTVVTTPTNKLSPLKSSSRHGKTDTDSSQNLESHGDFCDIVLSASSSSSSSSTEPLSESEGSDSTELIHNDPYYKAIFHSDTGNNVIQLHQDMESNKNPTTKTHLLTPNRIRTIFSPGESTQSSPSSLHSEDSKITDILRM